MIFISTDILSPYKREVISEDSYKTLIDFLQDKYPSGFERPTDVSVNGLEIAIDDYDISLNEKDVIVLLDRAALPVGLIGGWFITALANLAISVTLSYVANKLFAPDAPGERASPSSVYSINNAQNIARFGSPIPIIYGKVRMYPSMIVQPYYKYENNIEYLYHVLCIGQGSNTTDEILIGDDAIGNSNTLQWKLLNRDSFYDIPSNAYGIHVTKTISNPSNMELKNDVPSTAESEKYLISQDASRVEFDYFYPNGLSWVDGDGDYQKTYTAFKFRIYTLSYGIYTQVSSTIISIDINTPDNIQKTFTKDISSYGHDIYVSFEKTYGANDRRTTNTTFIKRVKEIHPNEDFTHLYGDITLLACKIKATNAISTIGQVKVNGYFERTDIGNTMAEVLTDLYTNTSYGGGLSADDLSFPITTETVNCAYDSNMTIFDAMRKPALAQGYSLYLAGMDVILKKDGVNTLTSGMYNEMNILKNTLKVQYLFKEEYPSYDGFECTYIDATWTPVTEIYPATSSRPQQVDLFGVVERDDIVYHLIDMLITSSVLPVFDITGTGELQIEDLGDGSWHVWSDNDTITRIQAGTTATSFRAAMTHAVIYNAEPLTSMSSMWSSCTALETITANCDMSSVTALDTFAIACSSLLWIDMGGATTGNVTTMRQFAYDCISLEHIDIKGLDMTTVTDAFRAFWACAALVCMTNFDTEAVTTEKDYIFWGCTSLVQPDGLAQAEIIGINGANWVNANPCP